MRNNIIKTHRRSLVLLILIFTSLSIKAQTLTVEISNIQNSKGKIILSVFTSNEGFRDEVSLISNNYQKKDLKSDKMVCKIPLKPGTYGITLLDDENSDGQMEFSFIGVPKEGYGFSDFYHRGISKPEFEDFDFLLGENDKTVHVIVKYF